MLLKLYIFQEYWTNKTHYIIYQLLVIFLKYAKSFENYKTFIVVINFHHFWKIINSIIIFYKFHV
jgi:hypothetical protein